MNKIVKSFILKKTTIGVLISGSTLVAAAAIVLPRIDSNKELETKEGIIEKVEQNTAVDNKEFDVGSEIPVIKESNNTNTDLDLLNSVKKVSSKKVNNSKIEELSQKEEEEKTNNPLEEEIAKEEVIGDISDSKESDESHEETLPEEGPKDDESSKQEEIPEEPEKEEVSKEHESREDASADETEELPSVDDTEDEEEKSKEEEKEEDSKVDEKPKVEESKEEIPSQEPAEENHKQEESTSEVPEENQEDNKQKEELPEEEPKNDESSKQEELPEKPEKEEQVIPSKQPENKPSVEEPKEENAPVSPKEENKLNPDNENNSEAEKQEPSLSEPEVSEENPKQEESTPEVSEENQEDNRQKEELPKEETNNDESTPVVPEESPKNDEVSKEEEPDVNLPVDDVKDEEVKSENEEKEETSKDDENSKTENSEVEYPSQDSSKDENSKVDNTEEIPSQEPSEEDSQQEESTPVVPEENPKNDQQEEIPEEETKNEESSKQEELPNEPEEKEEQVIPSKQPEIENKPIEDEPKNEEQEKVPTEEEIKAQEEMLQKVNDAIKKSTSARSAYFHRTQSGRYLEDAYITFNKNQNRMLFKSGSTIDFMEEYIEGLPERYPENVGVTSSYYYQNRWNRTSANGTWVKQPSLQSSFGIYEFNFLKYIKSIKEAPVKFARYSTYEITIAKEDANKVADALFGYDTELCKENADNCNMFSNDVTITIAIDWNGYINFLSANWNENVVSNSKYKFSIRLDIFNYNIDVQRPAGINDNDFTFSEKVDEFTPTEKRKCADLIQNAYKKTRDVESATYKTNDKEVSYDRSENEALYKDNNGNLTYYKGENEYIDHDYVGPSYHQNSWTKKADSEEWIQNVRKHTTFTVKELYFLNHIFDVKDRKVDGNITTYTVEVLKYDANLAYSYAYNVSDKFSDNITFTVSVDEEGYIRELHIDVEDYKFDLVLSNLGTTDVTTPEDIEL